MAMTASRAVMIARICLGWSEDDLGEKTELTGPIVARLERELAEMTPSLFVTCMKAMDLDPARLYASAEGDDKSYLKRAQLRFPPDVVDFTLEYAKRVPGIVPHEAPVKTKSGRTRKGAKTEREDPPTVTISEAPAAHTQAAWDTYAESRHEGFSEGGSGWA